MRVLAVVIGAQELELRCGGEEGINIRVDDLGELGWLPLRRGPGLADEERRNALDEVGVLHELGSHGVLAAESLGDGPLLALAKLLECDADGGGRALDDGVPGLGSPRADLLGLVGGHALEGVEDLVHIVGGLEGVVDGLADVTTNGTCDGLVVGKTSGELLDCRVDNLEALLEGCVVLELQLAEAGLKVGKR